MPTYEYQCLKCKKKFDQLQKITAASLKKCIYCGGKVYRLISAGVGLIFKGSGFYITDYKNKPASTPKTEGKTETKTETKKESQTETKKEKNDKPSK